MKGILVWFLSILKALERVRRVGSLARVGKSEVKKAKHICSVTMMVMGRGSPLGKEECERSYGTVKNRQSMDGRYRCGRKFQRAVLSELQG